MKKNVTKIAALAAVTTAVGVTATNVNVKADTTANHPNANKQVTPTSANVATAKTAVNQAQATLTNAQNQAKRTTVTKEQAVKAYNTAQNNLSQANNDLKLANGAKDAPLQQKQVIINTADQAQAKANQAQTRLTAAQKALTSKQADLKLAQSQQMNVEDAEDNVKIAQDAVKQAQDQLTITKRQAELAQKQATIYRDPDKAIKKLSAVVTVAKSNFAQAQQQLTTAQLASVHTQAALAAAQANFNKQNSNYRMLLAAFTKMRNAGAVAHAATRKAGNNNGSGEKNAAFYGGAKVNVSAVVRKGSKAQSVLPPTGNQTSILSLILGSIFVFLGMGFVKKPGQD